MFYRLIKIQIFKYDFIDLRFLNLHQCFICTCHTILFSKLAHMMFVDSNLPIIRKSNQQKYNLEFLSTLLQPNEKHCILLDYQTVKICIYEKDTLNIWQKRTYRSKTQFNIYIFSYISFR